MLCSWYTVTRKIFTSNDWSFFDSVLPVVYIICAVENWHCIVMHYKRINFEMTLYCLPFISTEAPWHSTKKNCVQRIGRCSNVLILLFFFISFETNKYCFNLFKSAKFSWLVRHCITMGPTLLALLPLIQAMRGLKSCSWS